MKKLFVWDLHGVLEKGQEDVVLEISNRILKQFNYSERFTKDIVNKMYGKFWHAYFAHLLPHESPERHLELQEACFELETNNPDIIFKYMQANDDAHFVLGKIFNYHSQILISNTNIEALPIFIESIMGEKYFSDKNAFAVDSRDFDDKNKETILKDFLKNKEFDDIIIIGDSPGDMELKNVAGGKTYLYSHPGKPFRKCEADYKIRDLRLVLREL